MDCIVHGVEKSLTGLSKFHFCSFSRGLKSQEDSDWSGEEPGAEPRWSEGSGHWQLQGGRAWPHRGSPGGMGGVCVWKDG